MSGSVDLTSLFANLVPTSTSSTLLDIITGQSTGGTTENPILALQQAEANQTQGIAQTASQPAVQIAISQFTAAVAKAKSITQLLANPAFQQVFLTANGLSSQIGNTALVTQALMSDPSDTNSLAEQLNSSDTSWQSTVSTYNFYENGLAAIQKSSVISTLTSAYAEVTWRNSLDATTPGLSNALTFRAEASTITSVDQILGDPIMRAVVTTTLGLPEAIAIQPLEAQERAITSRLDITQFKNPKFVNQFVDQYLIAEQQNASSTSISSDSLTQLAGQLQGLIA